MRATDTDPPPTRDDLCAVADPPLEALRALLAAANLPTDDLDSAPLVTCGLLRGPRLCAAGGFEPHGGDGLLRSMVVAQGERGAGLGGQLLAQVETRAREAGVSTLFLLTETAERFFAARGYARVPRDSVPAAIAATAEFSALCPDTAVCMRKRLQGAAA